MGQLVNGKWGEDQAPKPGPHHYELGSTEFPFDPKDKGRYHLYVSTSCPFAQRAHITRNLKKLDAIDVSFVNPVQGDEGWQFAGAEKAGEFSVGDQVLGKSKLHEVYTAADPDYTGRVTVPLLIDTKPGSHSAGGSGSVRIVSNESLEIAETFSKVGTAGPDLEAHASEQKTADGLAGQFRGGVFKFGGVSTQAEYDAAIESLYKTVAELDKKLAQTKFLAGDEITLVDVNAFPFFLRFDTAHAQAFQITRAKLADYAHINAYLKRIYSIPEIKETVVFDDILRSSFNPAFLARFTSNRKETIVPALPQVDWITKA